MSNNADARRGIFRRIFLIYAVILLVAAAAGEFFITNAVRESSIADLKAHLVAQASLLEDEIDFRSAGPLDAFCRRIKQKTGARATVIALDGRVLGDSDTESVNMDNHGHRQEVQQAVLDGTGSSIRFSDTLRCDFLYVARRVELGGRTVGFIRLSEPLRDVDRSINVLRIRIIAVVIAVLLATALFFSWQVDRVRRLTQRIREFSKDIAKGNAGRKLFLEDAGEFNEIADSLNTMSDELSRFIAATDAEKNRLNVILTSIPDALFILDEKGGIVMASAAAANLFGNGNITGKPFIEVVRNNEFFSLIEEVRKTGKPGSAEITLDSPKERRCIVLLSPLRYGGQESLSGFVTVFHDVTQISHLERTRTDFVANISHELKTPITAITGFAETLLEGALDERENAVKFLETIRANSRRINSLIDDLMMISKIELGVIRIEKKQVPFAEAAEAVMSLLGSKAAGKKLSLSYSTAPGRDTILADRDRLIQILTNLVDNGIKFTEHGSVVFGTRGDNGGTVIFVADTGIGIPPKHLPRLGERFYRVDAGRSRSMGGTGLGLAIVKHLVKAHGWTMKIDSTSAGTTVAISIG
ncbi:MAG TPA: ATP-binding protein [Nitrospirota bacterium]|nr:ATP-binding protein [Nitrospirota bacterium]